MKTKAASQQGLCSEKFQLKRLKALRHTGHLVDIVCFISHWFAEDGGLKGLFVAAWSCQNKKSGGLICWTFIVFPESSFPISLSRVIIKNTVTKKRGRKFVWHCFWIHLLHFRFWQSNKLWILWIKLWIKNLWVETSNCDKKTVHSIQIQHLNKCCSEHLMFWALPVSVLKQSYLSTWRGGKCFTP